ncbi:hypothetical protein OC834_004537 [Tilletia horrida]|nr:hypothetical protein OC834_004537 [Tilletia horrida]
MMRSVTMPSFLLPLFLAIASLLWAGTTGVDALAPAPHYQQRSATAFHPRAEGEPLSIPLQHHARQSGALAGDEAHPGKRSRKDAAAWANAHRAHLRAKYRLSSAPSSQRQQQQVRRRGASIPSAGIGLTNFKHDSSWSGTVYIGTPPRPYELLLDTGSSDLWLSATRFNPADSSSFVRDDDAVFDVRYGSGNVSGFVGQDVVSMGRVPGQGPQTDQGHALFVSGKQTFAVATNVTSSINTGDLMAGIMGLAFESLAGTSAAPFWLAANLTQRTFGVYLKRQLTSLTDVSPSITGPGGVLTLGGVNTSLFIPGTENAVDVLERSYWLVNLDGLSVRGQQIGLQDLKRSAIDTGTTLIGGPDDVVAALYAKIPGAQPMNGAPGYYVYPCSSSSIHASMAFGGMWYTLPDIDFVGDIASDDLSYCMGAFFGLGTMPTDDLHWIVGGAFLKNVYARFDAGNKPGGDGEGNGGASGSGGSDGGGGAQVVFASLAKGLNTGTLATNFSANGLVASAAGRQMALRGRGCAAGILAAVLAMAVAVGAL